MKNGTIKKKSIFFGSIIVIVLVLALSLLNINQKDKEVVGEENLEDGDTNSSVEVEKIEDEDVDEFQNSSETDAGTDEYGGNTEKLKGQANGPLYYDDMIYITGDFVAEAGANSGLKLNTDMVEIAKKLGFELKPLEFYLSLSYADITSVEIGYDYLRGINLYLAAKDVNYIDKGSLREVYENLRTEYSDLKYGSNTTMDYDEFEFGFNGEKPNSEEKVESYEYLIGSETIPTMFFYPKELIQNEKISFDAQNGFDTASDEGIEAKWSFIKNKSKVYVKTLEKAQLEDLNKIKSVVKIYNKAYRNQDFNVFASILHKDNRESFGLIHMARMKEGTFLTEMTFVPNYINSADGVAMGFSYNISAEPKDGERMADVDLTEKADTYTTIEKVWFVENSKGDWELYFQEDLETTY